MNIGNGPGSARAIRSGMRSSFGGGMSTVAQDALSSKYCPASDAQWTSVMTAASLATGNPSSLYLMQEASGNLADSIGAATFTAAGAGSTYQQAVTGWTRTAVKFTENGSNKFTATIPNANANSYMLLLYIAINSTPVSAIENVLEHPMLYAEVNSSNVLRANGASVGLGLTPLGTGVRPLVIQSSRGRSVLKLYNNAEIVDGGYASAAGTSAVLGGTASKACPMSILYGAAFTGSAADMTNAQIKTLLQTLGWTVAW